MSTRPARILLIEDNPGDVRLLRELLRDAGGYPIAVEDARGLKEGLDRLAGGGIDAVLLDLGLSESQGLESFRKVHARFPDIPVVVMTGLDDQTVAARAVREGAQDYLVKGQAGGELVNRSIRYAIERLRAARAVRESEERFRTLVESSPVGIFILLDGRIVFQNRRHAQLIGRLPDGFPLREFRDVPEGDEEAFGRLCDAIESGNGHMPEMELRFYPYGKSSAAGAGMRWAVCSTIPIDYVGEKAVLATMVDVTLLKEMEVQARVQQKLASLGQVAAWLAHEIRNPLSGLNILLSNLEAVLADPTARAGNVTARIIGQMKSASAKIESVIRRIMDFSTPHPPRFRSVNPNKAVEEALGLLSALLRKQGVRVDTVLAPDLPSVRADIPMIEQVLLNLVTNASQAMEKAGGPRRIEISSIREGESVVLSVSDSGPGIRPDIREKIFDPFYTTRRDGSGIGLSISQRIVADHGGKLSVGTSRLGGAEFRLSLPIEKPADPA